MVMLVRFASLPTVWVHINFLATQLKACSSGFSW
jgi:hypothetical protein